MGSAVSPLWEPYEGDVRDFKMTAAFMIYWRDKQALSIQPTINLQEGPLSRGSS